MKNLTLIAILLLGVTLGEANSAYAQKARGESKCEKNDGKPSKESAPKESAPKEKEPKEQGPTDFAKKN